MENSDSKDSLGSAGSEGIYSGDASPNFPASRSIINLADENSDALVGLSKSSLISISGTEKVTEATGKSYTVYLVNVSAALLNELVATSPSAAVASAGKSGEDSVVVQRRYSDFESMHKILRKRYQHIVVPPIPEKHSITDLSKKDDIRIVDMRRHLLTTFLLRLHHHPILSADPLFLRFLQPGNWSEVLFSQQQAQKKQKSATDLLGVGKKLRNPDLKFTKVEEVNEKQSSSFTCLEREDLKLRKKLLEMSATQGELGAVLNAFSLHEGNHALLALAVEKIGQVIDTSSLASSSFASNAESFFGHHFHEYRLFSANAEKVLKTRHKKHAYYETLGEQLDTKRIQLSHFEKGTPLGTASSNPLSSIWTGVSSVTEKFQQMMDSDPETTRKAQIAKLKESISTLEKGREDAHTDLIKFSEQVSAEMDRYQQQQIVDFHDLALSHAKIMRSWLQKNLEAWKAAQKLIGN